jgi:hypothetical protein
VVEGVGHRMVATTTRHQVGLLSSPPLLPPSSRALAFISSIMANALLKSVFVSTGVCAVVTSVGGARRDGDDGSICGVLGSAAIREDLPQLDSGAPPMGMATPNPTAAQIDRQRNPLIETRAL